MRDGCSCAATRQLSSATRLATTTTILQMLQEIPRESRTGVGLHVIIHRDGAHKIYQKRPLVWNRERLPLAIQ